MELRPRGDPVALRVDLLDQAVLAAGGPERAVGEGEQRGRDRQRDAAPRPAGAGVHADHLGAARDPDRAGAGGDPGRVRHACAMGLHRPARRDLPRAACPPARARGRPSRSRRATGRRAPAPPGANGSSHAAHAPCGAPRRAPPRAARPPSSAQAERPPKTRSCGALGQGDPVDHAFRAGIDEGDARGRRRRAAAPPVSASSSPPLTSATTRRGHRRQPRPATAATVAGGGRGRRSPASAPRAAAISSAQLPKRSAGSFAVALAITSSSPSGRPGLRSRSRGGALVQVRVHDRELALAVERRRAGQALVEDAAERVHVGAPVDLLALDLLGRDVGDRPHEGVLPGQAADRRGVLGEPEVAQVGVLALVAGAPPGCSPA